MGDARHDGLRVEHREGGRDELARHLTEARATAREVRGAIGERDAAGFRGTRAEAERGVALMALGREVDRADDRLEVGRELARRGVQPRVAHGRVIVAGSRG